MYWLLAASLAAALIVIAVNMKRQDSRIEEDGGTRHYIDTDAPKVIDSTEITFFHCKFSTFDIPLIDSTIAGNIIILHAEGSGGSYCLRNRSEVNSEGSFIPDTAFFGHLQQLVSRYDLAQHNGQHYTVSGLPPDFGIDLEIRYASGERIRSSNNQSCFLSLEAMEELVALFQQQ